MRTDITRRQTPEELELNSKLYKLSELEAELAQCELNLATLQAELHTFETRYIHTVGVRLADLDEIAAQIADAEAQLKPKDKKIQEQSTQARTQANESAQAAWITEEPREEKFKPSNSLKKLYREVAKRIHPDLVVDEKERIRRQKLMANANHAYEEGDEAKLRAILADWESSPEAVKGEGIPAELVRVIRKIAQGEKRLRVIETEISQLEESDLNKLKAKTEKAEDEGQDLLAEMASQVDKQIVQARERLVKITKR